MNKSRAEDNKRLRQRRKDAGLVQYRCWCTPEQRKTFKLLEEFFKKADAL